MTHLAQAQAEIETAAFRSVLDIPPLLSHAVTLLESVRAEAQTCPPEEREAARARIKAFRSKLSLFSSAMRRSCAIFEGYSRHAGVTAELYTPAGISAGSRDPAFFSLSV